VARSRLALVVVGVLAVAEVALLAGGWAERGALPTRGLLAATAVRGGWLTRREGAKAWAALRAGSTPEEVTARLSDAALVVAGGVLLALPGFLTDLAGLACLVPATRPLARRGLAAVLGTATKGYRARIDVLDVRLRPDTVVPGQVVEDEPQPRRPDDPTVIRGEVEP